MMQAENVMRSPETIAEGTSRLIFGRCCAPLNVVPLALYSAGASRSWPKKPMSQPWS